jgi:GTPase
MMIGSADDVVTAASNFTSSRICPIFQLSSVTGANIELLHNFLNLLSSRHEPCENEPAEFQMDETYSVPGVGTVVSGTVLKGVIRLNDTLMLGPDSLGHFQAISIRSIHRKRMPVSVVKGGQAASFALKKVCLAILKLPMCSEEDVALFQALSASQQSLLHANICLIYWFDTNSTSRNYLFSDRLTLRSFFRYLRSPHLRAPYFSSKRSLALGEAFP